MFRSTALIAALMMSTTACDELPLGDYTSVEYWGEFFLNKFETERIRFNTEIEPGPTPIAKPRTVLLVTGVTIPAEWMDGLRTRLERDGFNTVMYEPPELLSYDLFDASDDLADVVAQVLADTGEETIDILAECTGGVIARHYVQSLGGDASIDRLVTFVSPQAGVEKAPYAMKFVDWPALRDLTPGSDFLDAVASVPLPKTVDMTSIYSCTDEYITPYTTSIVEGATNIGLCDGFVGHFQTMYDPQIYLIMHNALVQPLSFADDEDNTSGPGDDDETGDIGDDVDDSVAGCSAGGSAPLSGLLLLGIALAVMLRSRRRDGRAL